ncbi:MAG TPA: hypothetical protein VLF18_01075 [Tahibacter sp.]|uniref:hypothetical protein n=1 Tax=Tahibacter sp. TaxID=2056211 RepID=UPI002B79CAC0|nr:hypothetical protein [Tahibacter sp.]HSX58767.1 hypothetical protein [Tahibacter sp.]
MSEHDFQWRRQLRDLSGPAQPQRDLWLDIASRIEAEQAAVPVAAPHRRRWAAGLAVAASVALAVLVAGVLQRHSAPSNTVVAVRPSTKSDPVAAMAAVDEQFKQVRTQDPRLAAAAVELDAAAEEIRQMLQQQPDAVFLVGLLNRTNERRLKLARMGQASS